jgi:hypothetical protein
MSEAIRENVAQTQAQTQLPAPSPEDQRLVGHLNAELDSQEKQLHAANRKLAATVAETERAMSDNVRKCPVFKPRSLPKPPEVPDDVKIEDVVVACADVSLSPAQKIALAALVCGKTALWAAHKANVSPRTIYRWRQEALFKETLESLSDTTMDAAVIRMRTLLLRSTHVISTALLQSDQERWAMRIIASPQVWKMGRRPEPAVGMK